MKIFIVDEDLFEDFIAWFSIDIPSLLFWTSVVHSVEADVSTDFTIENKGNSTMVAYTLFCKRIYKRIV